MDLHLEPDGIWFKNAGHCPACGNQNGKVFRGVFCEFWDYKCPECNLVWQITLESDKKHILDEELTQDKKILKELCKWQKQLRAMSDGFSGWSAPIDGIANILYHSSVAERLDVVADELQKVIVEAGN